MHLVCDIGGSIPVRDSGAIQFFSVQALGFLLEDGMQEVYRRIRGDKSVGLVEKSAMRIMGYIWVVAFLTWSGPAWVYPLSTAANKEDNYITFTNFRSILPF